MIYHVTKSGKEKAKQFMKEFKNEFDADIKLLLDGTMNIISNEGDKYPKKAEKMAYDLANKVKKFLASKGMKTSKFDLYLEYEADGYWPAISIVFDPSYFGTEIEED